MPERHVTCMFGRCAGPPKFVVMWRAVSGDESRERAFSCGRHLAQVVGTALLATVEGTVRVGHLGEGLVVGAGAQTALSATLSQDQALGVVRVPPVPRISPEAATAGGCEVCREGLCGDCKRAAS